jgi:hypothetical protein
MTVTLFQTDNIAEVLDLANMSECYRSKSKGNIFVKGLSKSKTPEQDLIEMKDIPY